jgi:hypothetical protein
MAATSNAPSAQPDAPGAVPEPTELRPKRLPLAPREDTEIPLVPARIINTCWGSIIKPTSGEQALRWI